MISSSSSESESDKFIDSSLAVEVLAVGDGTGLAAASEADFAALIMDVSFILRGLTGGVISKDSSLPLSSLSLPDRVYTARASWGAGPLLMLFMMMRVVLVMVVCFDA